MVVNHQLLFVFVQGHNTEKVEKMEKKEERLLTIRFNADTAAQMRWNFRYNRNNIIEYQLPRNLSNTT